MIKISRRERKTILEHFPAVEIVSTRHSYFLVCRETDTPARLLFDLRGIKPPPSRRERAATARSGNGYGYDRQRRPYQKNPKA